MNVDKKILKEIERFNSINKYINEQELPPPPAETPADPMADPAATAPVDPLAPPPVADPMAATPPAEPQPVDVEQDPDVEKMGGDEVKELDITDLVTGQKDLESKQDEYFEKLFGHLSTMEEKLSEMDGIVNKLNDLESKIEKVRPKTPEEKMELRSLDSGPFNQKLSQYFEDKEDDFEKLGRDEYILTKDEVEDFTPSDIKKSFRDFDEFGDNSGFKKI